MTTPKHAANRNHCMLSIFIDPPPRRDADLAPNTDHLLDDCDIIMPILTISKYQIHSSVCW
jgi:hypothetical protein